MKDDLFSHHRKLKAYNLPGLGEFGLRFQAICTLVHQNDADAGLLLDLRIDTVESFDELCPEEPRRFIDLRQTQPYTRDMMTAIAEALRHVEESAVRLGNAFDAALRERYPNAFEAVTGG